MSMKLRTELEETKEMNRIEWRRKGEACRLAGALYIYIFMGIVCLFVCPLVSFQFVCC